MSGSHALIWIPLSALSAGILLHVLALRIFPRLKLLDFPKRYGLKRKPIPYPTGILSIGLFLVFLFIFFANNTQAMGVVMGVILLGTVSFLDDRRPLPPILRLITQLLVALIIFLTGTHILSLTNPLEGIAGMNKVIELNVIKFQTPMGVFPLLSMIFTFIWLGLTINALNWFDGIPGQVSTLSTIGFLTIGFLSLSDRVQQPELALIAFILAGISAACFFFDFPPEKVLMGDSGAMFFGLMLGVLTIYSGGKVATAFLVLGVPLIDSVIVSTRRVLSGKAPLNGSSRGEHLHHRLLEKGWSPRKIILLTASLGILFGITALFLSTREKFLSALILLIVILLLHRYSRSKT